MSQSIFDREYHRTRLARRRLKHHVQPFFGYWISPEFRRLSREPRLRRLPVYSPAFATYAEAAEWARSHPEGTHWKVGKHYRSVEEGLFCPEFGLVGEVRMGGKDAHTYYYGILFERLGAPFREAVATWEAEVREAAYLLEQSKRWTDKGGYQGHGKKCGKHYRHQFVRERRAAARRMSHLALRGQLDDAEGVDLHVRERGLSRWVW